VARSRHRLGERSLKSGRLDVRTGFVDKKPRDVRFARELEREIDALSRSFAL